MAKKNDDFFKVKKPWSEVKDELLRHYLKPYFQKILHTRRAIVYVDCFAGKGAFEDGNPGSPLIALHTIQDCLGQTTMTQSNIQSYFIDLNYAADLAENLRPTTTDKKDNKPEPRQYKFIQDVGRVPKSRKEYEESKTNPDFDR